MNGLLPIPHQAITKPMMMEAQELQSNCNQNKKKRIIQENMFESACKMLASLFCVTVLSLVMLETEYSGFGINTMPADALVPKVTSASAGMVLVVYERQHVLLFQHLFHLLG